MNVNVIPMDRERVEQRQTVVVRGDRIAAIGAANDISVPEGARSSTVQADIYCLV